MHLRHPVCMQLDGREPATGGTSSCFRCHFWRLWLTSLLGRSGAQQGIRIGRSFTIERLALHTGEANLADQQTMRLQ